jgi:hypothetical protein
MSAWKPFVSAALVGTGQAKLPPLPGALAEFAAGGEGAGREVAFLARAGALALWLRAGWQPARDVRSPAPAREESRASISAMSANHLRRLLRGDFAAFLPGWLKAVDQAGLRVPFEQAPALLDAARQTAALRPLVAAVVGERGAWLAAQNPDWDFAVAAGEDPWETGAKEQRIRFFKRLRLENPAEALARLQACWKAEPAETRSAFLAALRTGLSKADEPFLESALGDRGKEVRRAAADLLARLPDSELVARMKVRAAGLLAFQPGRLLAKPSLSVSLPAEPDAAGLRDGLDPKAFAGQSDVGEKAGLLLQILGAVPPAWWNEKFQAPAETLIAAAKKSEFLRVVISGWALAAVRHTDRAWLEALLRGPVPTGEWLGGGSEFLNVLAPEARAAWLAQQIRNHGLLDSGQRTWSPALAPLLAFESDWPEPLARQVAGALTGMARQGIAWHLRAETLRLLLRLPPELAARTASGWPQDKESVSELAEFAAFRLEALTALTHPHNPYPHA